MAANTLKSTDKPRRANVPREAPTPAPAPEVRPVAAVEASPAPAPEKRPRKPVVDAGSRSSWSLFSLLDRVTNFDGLFREGLPVRYLPHLLYIMGLTLLYIGNTHYGNRMNRNIQRLKQETEDLRADYTTLKSDYMEASKQSEVARKVAAFGLVESSSPPFRITVPAGHLDAAELELMPVLTADTLAARAARDSAATERADILAGRKRASEISDDDTGPEIIAPPQLLDGDELDAPVVRTPARPAAPKAAKPTTGRAKKAAPGRKSRASARKPDRQNRAPKGPNKHKGKASDKHAVRSHSR